MADVNANINVNINSSAALAGLKRLEQQIESFQRSVSGSNASAAAQQNALNRSLLQGINNTGLFTAKQISAVDSVGKFTNSLEKNKLSLGEYSRYAGSQLPGLSKVFKREFNTMQAVAVDRVKSINSQYLALGKTVDGVTSAIKSTPTGLSKGYSTDMAIATQRQQMFNKLIDGGSTKLLNWGKNTQWAGRQLMVGFTIPLTVFATVAAKTFKDIEEQAINFKKVYGDIFTTDAEVEENLEAVKQLSLEMTKYGIAVKDTMALASIAAQSGLRTADMLAATNEATRLATLGQMEQTEAMKTVISMQTAFGQSNEELSESVNFLNIIENQTVLSLQDVAGAIPRVAPVIKGMGGDVKDLAILLVAMKEGGVSAAEGANALKNSLARLITPTSAASGMAEKFGINLEGIVERNNGKVLPMVRELAKEMESLGGLDQQKLLSTIFGKFQYARIGALMNNIRDDSSQAARAMDLMGMSTEDLARTAEDELSVVENSISTKFTAALEQAKLSIAPLGEAFLRVATPVVEMVSKIANAFSDLPEPVKNAMGMAVIAIGGIAPVLLMGIGLMGNLIANVIKGIQQFRKFAATIKGDSSAFQYMAKAELEALAASEALEANTMSLTGKLQLQAGAVRALSTEYQRFASAAGIASGAMRSIPVATGAAGRGKPPLKMARGGVVPGSGSGDKIPALLEPGETVITKKASQRFGPVIAAMNAGNLPGYQGGLNLPNVSIPSSASFRKGSTQGIEAFFKSIQGLSGASEAATKVLTNLSVEGGKINAKAFKEAMVAEGMVPQLPTGRAAAHLTSRKDLSESGKSFLESRTGRGEGGKSVTAQRLLSVANDPETAGFVKEYSGLTADLSQTLNTQLQTGAAVSDFNREWSSKGSRLLPSLEKFGGFVSEGADDLKALSQFEIELGQNINGRADVMKNAIVTDEILEAETKKLISQYKNANTSIGKVARSADQASKTIGQVSVSMNESQAEALVRQGKASKSVTAKETRYLSSSGAVLGRKSKSSGTFRPERYGKLAKAGQSTTAAAVMGAKQSLKVKSPSEEFAKIMDDAAKGALIGAKRSQPIAAQSGRILGQSAKEAYKSEMSQLRRDIRNDDVLVGGGMTDPTQRTRTLRKLEESQKKQAKIVAAQQRKQSQAAAQAASLEQKRLANEQIILAEKQRKIQEDNEKRSQKRAQRKKSVSRGIGRAGGMIGMASMIPFMAQDSEGKFAGMDANMLGMGMMGASMAGPLMGGVKSGGVLLAGAMGVSATALASIVAPVAAISIAAVLLKKGMDNNIAAGKEYADAMTTSAQEQAEFAKALGNTTLAEKRKQKETKKITGLSAREQSVGRDFVASEQGQQMQTEAKKVLEQNASGFARNLATQLSQSVISGAMGVKQAKSVAAAMSEALGREDLTANIIAQIDKILAPNGDDITRSPLKISATIQANIESDEDQLRREADRAAANYSGIEDNFLGRIISGDYDEMVRKEIAFFEAVLANTQSILSTYDDQIMKQEEVVAEIDKKIKAEEDATKKEELEIQKRIAARQLANLEEKKIDEEKSRREVDYQALLGDVKGRAERMTSSRNAVQEAGIKDARALLSDETRFSPGGGSLGTAYYRATGNRLRTNEEAEEFEVRWLVDLQTGRIDPVALQALQSAEENKAGSAQNIIETVVRLQSEGDLKAANEINIISARLAENPEILTVFNTKIEGKKPEQIIAYGEVLNQISELPPEIYKSVAVELGDMPVQELQEFRDQIEQLQGMEIDVVSLLSQGGVKGIQAAANATDSFAGSLKKYAKEINSINKATSKEQKLERVISVVTKMVDAEGVEITPQQIKKQIPEIAKAAGITEAEVMVLPPAELVKVISASIMAQDLKDKGDQLVVAGKAMSSPALIAEGQAMVAAAALMMAGAGTAAAGGGYGGGDGKTPKVDDEDEENGGGGGTKATPFKDFKSGIILQIKRFADSGAKLKDLMKAKYDFFNILKMSDGIDDKIRKAGLNPLLAEELMNMDPKEANKVLNKMTGKGGRLDESGRKLQDRYMAASISGTLSAGQDRRKAARSQQKVTGDLSSRGVSGEAISEIIGDARKTEEYITLLDKAASGSKKAKKALDSYITSIEKSTIKEQAAASATEKAIEFAERRRNIAFIGAARGQGVEQGLIEYIGGDAGLMAQYTDAVKKGDVAVQNFFTEARKQQKQMQQEAYAMNPFEFITQQADEALDAIKSQFAPDQLRLEDESAAAFEAQFGTTKEAAQDIIDKNNILISQYDQQINQYEDMNAQEQRLVQEHEREKKQWQDKIDAAQEYINGWQKSIDSLNKEISQRNHQADLLNHELDLIGKAEEDINATYDKRMDALDEVESINNRILQSQRSQLDISRALSTGDVYAAAAAAQEMQDQQAQQAMVDARDALTTARDNQVSGLRGESGMSRTQIEDQLWQINQQNYQTGLLIYDLEDKIWQKNQETLTWKTEIDKIDKSIKEHTDKIWENSGEILRIQKDLIGPLKSVNTQWTDRLSSSNLQLSYDKDHLKYQGKTLEAYEKQNERMNAHLKQIDGARILAEGLYDTWVGVGNAIADANKTAKQNLSYAAKGEFSKITGINYKDYLDETGEFDYGKFQADVEAIRTSAVQGAVDSGTASLENNYAGGFISGDGARDSVRSTLTPGEFIVRKSMVKKYGVGMFEKINQGSFSMPRYNTDSPSTNVEAPSNNTSIVAPVYNTYSISVPVNQPNASADEIAYKVMTKIKSIESSSIRRINGY